MNRQTIEALKKIPPITDRATGIRSSATRDCEIFNSAIDAVLAQIDGTDINGELLDALKEIKSELEYDISNGNFALEMARAAIANAEKAALTAAPGQLQIGWVVQGQRNAAVPSMMPIEKLESGLQAATSSHDPYLTLAKHVMDAIGLLRAQPSVDSLLEKLPDGQIAEFKKYNGRWVCTVGDDDNKRIRGRDTVYEALEAALKEMHE